MNAALLKPTPARLGECYAGDIVVVEIEGEYKFVYIGNILWQGRERKKVLGQRETQKIEKVPTQVLVDLVDPYDLVVEPYTWQAMHPDTKVVDVVESGLHRREQNQITRASRMKRVTGHDPRAVENVEVDPMKSRAQNGDW